MRGEVVALRRRPSDGSDDRPGRSHDGALELRDALCTGRLEEFFEELLAEAAPPPPGNPVGLLSALRRPTRPVSVEMRLRLFDRLARADAHES